MFRITLPADRTAPDMAAVARAFGLEARALENAIKTGAISRCAEVGDDDADNKPHQVFISASLEIRVEVDEHGTVRSVSDYGAVTA